MVISAIATRPAATMKAVVQERFGPGDVLRLREIARPVVADDGVLVKVRAASINALDYHVMHMPLLVRLLFGAGVRRPRDPLCGKDLAGHVEAVGKDVTRFKPGDAVFGTGAGSWAEYATSSEKNLAPKPSALSFEEAAAVGVAGCTALQGLRDAAQVRPGQRVLVYGAGGGVGTFAVQIAKALGAHVTAMTSTKNLELVRSTGADEVIDYTQEDFVRRGERYDVFFDVAANRSLADCRRALAPNGILVAVGGGKGGWIALLSRVLLARVQGRFVRERVVMFMAQIRQDDLVALKDLIEAGKVRPVIDRRYPLSEAADAVRYAASGQARAKVVLTIG